MKKIIFACFMLFSGMLQAADYPLGAGDMLRISVYGNADLTTETRVTAGGMISFPLVGDVKVAGSSLPAAERKIANLLKSGGYIKQPHINIVVLQFVSGAVMVLGDVQKPGRYPLDHSSSLVEMLAIAGGIAANGSDQLFVISHKDGKAIRQKYDLPELLSKSDNPDVEITPGDIIYVPRAPVFYIYGEAQRPGVFRLERDMTVEQALAVGGGLTARGTERGLRLKRRNAQGELETIRIEASTPVLAGDVLQIQESLF